MIWLPTVGLGHLAHITVSSAQLSGRLGEKLADTHHCFLVRMAPPLQYRKITYVKRYLFQRWPLQKRHLLVHTVHRTIYRIFAAAPAKSYGVVSGAQRRVCDYGGICAGDPPPAALLVRSIIIIFHVPAFLVFGFLYRSRSFTSIKIPFTDIACTKKKNCSSTPRILPEHTPVPWFWDGIPPPEQRL